MEFKRRVGVVINRLYGMHIIILNVKTEHQKPMFVKIITNFKLELS